ncbi:MAG TPA: tRNA dihydrouridine synthase DusB [Thermotoga sp.]|nr:tRNA dihydrouridine synthase DusB [Thermotoga sp.]
MAGITDKAFRTICREFGASFSYSEMISADGYIRNSLKTKDLLPTNEDFTAVQIFGSDPFVLSEAASKLSEQFDWIDLNAGCPVKKVIKKGAGGALIKDLKKFRKVVRDMRKSIKGVFSVKTRLGWERNDFEKIYNTLLEEGVDIVAVHTRTVCQGFKGKANWKELDYLNFESLPVLISGDILTPEDAKKALETVKCQGVLVARGAIGRPWIFKQIKDFFTKGVYEMPSFKEIGDIALKHLDLLRYYKGEEKAVKEFRKFIVGYTKNIPNSKEFRRKIMVIENINLLKESLDVFFKKHKDNSII